MNLEDFPFLTVLILLPLLGGLAIMALPRSRGQAANDAAAEATVRRAHESPAARRAGGASAASAVLDRPLGSTAARGGGDGGGGDLPQMVALAVSLLTLALTVVMALGFDADGGFQ